jgi:hypothetical protein
LVLAAGHPQQESSAKNATDYLSTSLQATIRPGDNKKLSCAPEAL